MWLILEASTMVQASSREIKTYTTHYHLQGFNLTRLYSTEDSHLWIEKQYPLLIKLESHALAIAPECQWWSDVAGVYVGADRCRRPGILKTSFTYMYLRRLTAFF
jgi:hypothetical protein